MESEWNSHFSAFVYNPILESFQNLFDIALVLCDIIRVDQDVVQIDYYTHIQEIGEHVVHEMLEGSWSVS